MDADCSEVTTGLYLGHQEVGDALFLKQQVAKGLGLSPWALPPNHPRYKPLTE